MNSPELLGLIMTPSASEEEDDDEDYSSQGDGDDDEAEEEDVQKRVLAKVGKQDAEKQSDSSPDHVDSSDEGTIPAGRPGRRAVRARTQEQTVASSHGSTPFGHGAALVDSNQPRFRRNRGHWSADGSFFIPWKKPRVGEDGLFLRPQGRHPQDMAWDARQGIWRRKGHDSKETSPDTGPSVAASSENPSTTTAVARPAAENKARSVKGLLPSERSRTASTATVQPMRKRKSSGDDEKLAVSALIETSGNNNTNKQKGRKKTGTNTETSVNEHKLKWHPNSKWQEPPREDRLTLYEVHRKPRRVISGRLQRPLKMLYPEFRCVICLGYIRRTRIVMECLHRFCEECIERSLRMGRNECPICRVFVPSRRSLAPDPNFDRLIKCILGQKVLDDDYYEEEIEVPAAERPTNLQKQIHLKKQHMAAQQEKETEDDVAEDDTDDNDDEKSNNSTVSDTNSPSVDQPSLVEIHLQRHPDESELPDLLLPFIRLSAMATIKVVKNFLRRKLSNCFPDLTTNSLSRPQELSLQVVSTWQGKPLLVADWVSLDVVAKRLHDRPPGNCNHLTLFYRLDPKTGSGHMGV